MKLSLLMELFDLYFDGKGSEVVCKPTSNSVKIIENELSCKLPPSLIMLGEHCKYFSSWFSSIGDDFNNPSHILNTNKIFKECDPDNPKAGLPEWFVMFNLGYDEDCEGFDSRNIDNVTGEYPVYYWDSYEGLEFTPSEPITMSEYLEALIVFWFKSVDKEKLKKMDEIIAADQLIK